MRLEGEHGRWYAVQPRRLAQALEHGLVAEMDAVEIADSERDREFDARAGAAKDLHEIKLKAVS